MIKRLKRLLKAIRLWSLVFGLDTKRLRTSFKALPWFIKDYIVFKNRMKRSHSEMPIRKLYPCLRERAEASGTAMGHYFHQDLLVAQMIFKNNPKRHIDIGSRVDGLVAHVASFRKIEVIDIRPLKINIPNIDFVQCDIADAHFDKFDLCDSVSSLHALEHFGLGRYGDSIDPEGHIKGFNNISKMLMRGGKLYFSVPMGTGRVEFNAHRVFDLKYLFNLIQDKYRIDSFSYVDDHGDLHGFVTTDDQSIKNNYFCEYGCAIFELTKK